MGNIQHFSLREATEADSNAVYALKKAAFSQYVKKQHGYWNEAEQLNYHQERFTYQDIKIIMVDHDAVGFVSAVNESKTVTVNQLMIAPEYQGKGIGERCMAVITHEAQRLGNPVHLQVLKINPRAMKFYQRIGFIITAETEKHYQMEFTSHGCS